ncbi:hypothetical protein ACNSOL_12125 (plasmid) [Aliarcobacter lanthieri]|uniref:hypothetical protein n=1 Tax=Aliarcobacter lanthieri TaxID=1355374 RepID=UPI003AAC5D2E
MLNFMKKLFLKDDNKLKNDVKQKLNLKNKDLKTQRNIFNSLNRNNKYKNENDFLTYLLVHGPINVSSSEIEFTDLK